MASFPIMILKPFPSLSLYAIFLFFSFIQANAFLAGNETDFLSLIAIRDRIQGLSSWNQSLHFCQWQGITCGNRHKRVIDLNLGNQSLVGSIAPHIGNLTFLRLVNVSYNKLYGEIPPEIGQLHRLERLSVRGNGGFEGNIPSNISRCTNLVRIDLSENKLSGNIPKNVGSLSNLRYLNLFRNNFTGQIPHSLGNLSFLQVFNLAENNLEGSIPETIGRVSNLTWFSVELNRLLGEVPPSLYNISSINLFSITQNQITGSLPQDLFITLPNLVQFFAGGTHLSGSLPFSLANASNIEVIQLSNNNFTGKLPTNLYGLKNLEVINLANNNFGRGEADDLSFIASLTNSSKLRIVALNFNSFQGVIPDSISNLSIHMNQLYMGVNQLSGIIPEGIGNLVNLFGLGIEYNHLHGSIPSSLGRLQSLQILYLGGNSLTGSIPSSLASANQLSQLDLASNNLSGSIPTSLGVLRHLISLNLSDNNLNGSIPKQIFNISSLSRFLVLSHNSFTGFLPLEVGKLINLGSLDLSGNRIFGKLPSTLAKCVLLEELFLDNNLFQGTIPASLSSLKSLKYIDLSSNKLSGQIPKYFEDFHYLESLNLSLNELEGKVPMKGIFRNATAISLTGNQKLCGGIHELQLQKCQTKGRKKEGNSIAFKLAIGIALPVFFLLASFLLIIYVKRKKRANTPSTNTPSTSFRGKNFVISYGALYQATDGFSATNLVGSGSYGRVYKGLLNEDEMVAVKVFNLQRKGAAKSFVHECESLRTIRHRNLTKILTCCASVDYEGHDFKALVFEFMPNGSLDKWLYGDAGVQARKLNLLQRLNIAFDVASALKYLHYECVVCIIHRDLKPSNVLLDSDMVAHVSDFGLAKLLSGSLGHYSKKQSTSIGVKGSIGYIAPEYGMGGEASKAGDVYSYGILLLELFTARRPTDTEFVDGLNLRSFAEMALPNHVMEVVDPILSVIEEGSKAQRVQECIAEVLNIGVACSADSAGERMSMEDVTKALHHIIKETFGLIRDGTTIDHLRGTQTYGILQQPLFISDGPNFT